ncbi:MAG: putative glycosyl transferase [Bacteroidetes bacterium ADurb.Bin141]|nr:MAG: putative glycosyl transferase [Bacteroidetes bacterium ADurb.Bin141]
MKKVLVITYYWPPSGGAGVQRWLKFVKYLRQYGWEPVVFTVADGEFPERDDSLLKDIPEGIEIIREPIKEPYLLYKLFIGRGRKEKIHAGFLTEKKKSSLLQNIAVWIRGNFFIPDARMLWIKPSVNNLHKWLEQNKVDALVSTGPPHSCHLIALRLKKLTGIPWLADFRDPWTKIDYYKDLKLTARADRKHHRLEREVISNADAVVTVGKTMQEEFAALVSRDIDCITNGYDDEDITKENVVPDKEFSIAHVGTMVKTRNPVALWQALSELLKEEPEFKNYLLLKLVGKVDVTVQESLKQYGLINNVKFIDYLSHEDVVKVQRQSQILLLVINRTHNAKGVLTGKLFEYMAARRPVICIGPVDGDAAEIINETQCGKTVDYDDGNSLKKIVNEYYMQYMNHKLNASSVNIEKYSRKILTEKLSQVLNRIIR